MRAAGATVSAHTAADPARTFAVMTSADPALFYPRFRVIRVRWTYVFVARAGCGPLVAAIVKTVWGPYMRRVLPGLVAAIR